jgi:GT2 family glycosyltransferase
VAEGITVITLSRDRPDLFKACSDHISSPHVIQKILVNNGTDEETRVIAHGAGWEVIDNPQNCSFSVGNNRAAERARGSHLLLVNNDARLQPGCIENLWKHRKHPLLGTLILDEIGRVNHAGVGYYAKNLMPVHYGRGLPVDSIYGDRFVPCVTFACVLIDIRLWHALGGLDEQFYYSYEDIDFCARAQEKGILARFVHDAVVIHNECSTRDPQEVDPANAVKFHNKWIKTRRLLDALGLAIE